MSIQIGNTATTVANLVTTRERVILKSSAFSNLINLSTTLNSNLITLDQYAFGRVASNFNLYEGLGAGSPILIQYNKVGTVAYTPFNVQNTLTALNMGVTNIANIATTNTSNFVAQTTADQTNATPFFSVKQNTGANIFTIAPNATASFAGNVGIGTAIPLAPLHVQTDALVSGNLAVATAVLANTFQSPGAVPHSIVIQSGANNGITLNGTTTVIGDFSVTGNQSFTQDINFINAYISGLLRTNNFSISNIGAGPAGASNAPALKLDRPEYSAAAACNLIEISASNEPVLYINPSGWVGLGTSTQHALLDICQNSLHGPATCNLFIAEGTQECDVFLIDKDANIGIGTNVANHRIHIYQCDESSTSNAPVIGLYFDSNIVSTSILCAYDSNYVSTVELSAKSLRIGAPAIGSSNYSLDITEGPSGQPRARIPWIETGDILAINCNISFHDSTLNASNMTLSNLNCLDTRVNYIFASNYEILGLQCFDKSFLGTSITRILTSNVWFSGYNFVFSSNTNETEIRSRDYIGEGKFLIEADAHPSGGISRGLSVNGVGNTGIRVKSSALVPYYELTNANTSVLMGLNANNEFFIKHNGDSVNKISVGQGGLIKFNDAVSVDLYGNLGIRLNNNATAAYPLHVNGRALFVNNLDNPVLFVDALNNNNYIGVGTTAPLYNFHVNGQSYFSENIGIGTTPNDNYKLNVLGNIYSSSNIYTYGSLISTSDARIKTNIKRIEGALNKVLEINGYTYNKNGVTKRETGLIAQELEAVLPEAVFEDPESKLLNISYPNLMGLIVEAIKELYSYVQK